MDKKEVLIIGGDTRQYYMAKHLLSHGYSVIVFGEAFAEGIDGCRILETKEAVFFCMDEQRMLVVLPVPVTVDGQTVKGTGGEILLEELCPHMKEKERIYGGNIPIELRGTCEMKQGQCMDFMKSERVAYLNAVPTAEGGIAEAIALGKGQLSGSHCLVIGFGRCGAVLADKLRCLGARVAVIERSGRKRARAMAYGLCSRSLEETEKHFGDYDYIFNTVPAQVVSRKILEACKRNVAIIDIASAPGGVDYEAARTLGIEAKLCHGLPGKYAPKTAGEILAEEIMKTETSEMNR